jgi:hypothetical protein
MPSHRIYHVGTLVKKIEWRSDQNYDAANLDSDAIRFRWDNVVLATNLIAHLLDKPYRYLSLLDGVLIFDEAQFLADIRAEDDELRQVIAAAKQISDVRTRLVLLFILRRMALE